MQEQDETVVDSAETTTDEDNQEDYEQTDSNGEDETEASTESSEQQSTETPEQKRARLTRQLERLNKKHPPQESEEGGKESRQESSKKEEVDDRYNRLELKMEGITSKKEQDVVLDYAKWKGIDVTKALTTPAVKAELAELRAKSSTPAPSKRTSTGANNSFEYWVGQAKKGNFPVNDPEMMDKLKNARIFTR